MKESEENLNSDFDLKVKHDISDRLKTEPPAIPNPSPILAATRERKNPLPVIILIMIAMISIIINVILVVLFFSSNSEISALEKELERRDDTISDLRSRLIESTSEK